MSTDQLSKHPSPRRSNDAKLVRYDDYIDEKIQSTRRTVKIVDLATALVGLVAGAVAFLTVVAVADHWLIPGGFSVGMRTVLFVMLVGGVGYVIYSRLWPLLAQSINPVYAARTIEQSSPSLKNGLINLLLLRQRRADISDAVYRTLEEHAAQGLTRVPVDTAVDRSLLIRLGYVLVAVVAVAGLYKVLSPKDPVVAAERVLLPWADIVPASRVSITGLTPGSTTVSRGEFVDVSAEVRGIGDDDQVRLRYSTDDGEIVGQAIPMKPAGDGLRFTCRVADESSGTQQIGLTRNLTYWLEAGDARSLHYSITVVDAPSILVDRVDYHYPAYTGYVDRSVEGLGDIRAIEGTRVTIHARANGPIREANVDFDADGRPDLKMSASGTEASVSFELALRGDRQTPRHPSYVLRFTNEDGRTNRNPVKHSINVERDYDPEVAIVVPKEKSINVRLDQTVALDVEARDPDFALAAVRLRGKVADREVLDEPLLKGERHGKYTTRYAFLPSAHGLHSGDVMQYWVEAADNRTPKPNVTATDQKLMQIGSPNPAQQPPVNQVAKNDRQQPQPGAEQENGRQGQQDQKNQDNGGAGQKGSADKHEGGESDKQQQPGNNQGQGDKQKERHGDGGASGTTNGNSEGKPAQDSSTKNTQGGEASEKQNQNDQNENGQGVKQSKSKQATSDEQKSNGEQNGAGSRNGESSKQADLPKNGQPDQGNGQSDHSQGVPSANGGQQKGKNPSQPSTDKLPVSSEGDNDGEAFDRIRQHLQRNGQLKDNGSQNQSVEQNGEQKQAANQSQGNKENGRHGEKDQAQQEAAKKKQPGGEGKSADGQTHSAENKTGVKPDDENGSQTARQQAKDRAEGNGAKTQGDDLQKQEPKSDRHTQETSPGGQQTTSKGPAGDGSEQKPQGAPNSKPGMKPIDKLQQSPSKSRSNQQEPPAGANKKRESDSHGDQGGDKAGGGEEGGGQKSPHDGTGSSGQNQSADKGAGTSTEKGKGEASPSAGGDAKSDHQTGTSGSEKGGGSKQQAGKGEQPGGTAGGENHRSRNEDNAARPNGEKSADRQGSQKTEQKASDQKSNGQSEKETGRQGEKRSGQQGPQEGEHGHQSDHANDNRSSNGASGGGGQPGTAVNPQPSIKGSAPKGDAANLEYARKQTDLILEKLSDELKKNKVDNSLLKDLGWSREDLQRFVERWQQRKEAAERDDAAGKAAKRDLDDALRSLGLDRGELRQSAVQKDSLRDLKEGYRGPVPLEYRERLRAYNQGVSRARQDGE
ncbi:MAG TPA: hypothetical protein VHE81_14810 [Lacipirellulaceae bacterium]|nr:hypothetical protein [Lacipirellulaceae bacterium]